MNFMILVFIGTLMLSGTLFTTISLSNNWSTGVSIGLVLLTLGTIRLIFHIRMIKKIMIINERISVKIQGISKQEFKKLTYSIPDGNRDLILLEMLLFAKTNLRMIVDLMYFERFKEFPDELTDG